MNEPGRKRAKLETDNQDAVIVHLLVGIDSRTFNDLHKQRGIDQVAITYKTVIVQLYGERHLHHVSNTLTFLELTGPRSDCIKCRSALLHAVHRQLQTYNKYGGK